LTEEKKKVSTGGRGITDYILHMSSQPTITAGARKGCQYGGNLLNDDREGLQKIRVATTRTEPEKITNMVGTFLNDDREGLQKIRVATTKTEPEKVTNMVGTFLNEGGDGARTIRVTTKADG